MPANHILIPLHDFSAGGTELVAFRLARHWLAAGRRVSIFAGASDGPLRARVPDGVDVHVLTPEKARSTTSRLFLGHQMAPVARALAPDAIFIPGNFHFLLARGLRAALPHAVIVAKASNPVWSDDWVPAPIARALVAMGTSGIDHIVAMADALKPSVARYISGDRIIVIDDPFLNDETTVSSRPPSASKEIRLLAVARLEAQKDPALAISVVRALRAQGHDARLTMLGGGPFMPALQNQIGRHGLADQVTLAGYVADPTPHYAAADMLLMTSHFEGVPAVIGEALVHGIPFVATECSPWVTGLARNHPALGTVVPDRSPETLASAIEARRQRAFPAAVQVETGIGAHRGSRAAQAYLTLFDGLI